MFDRFMNSKIKLIKQNGSVVDNIKASIQDGRIFVNRSDIIFDEGDTINRILSNGKVENYTIISATFYENFGGIPAHYELKVHKNVAGQEKIAKATSITVNASGNAKINIDSVDNSITNTYSNDSKLFEDLLNIISKNIEDNKSIIKLVEEMRDNVSNKEVFKIKYSEFIQSVANHITVVAPFIPYLTKLL